MFRGTKVITACEHVVWPAVLRVWEFGERTELIWKEQSEIFCPLSGDRIFFNLFTLPLVIRKEALIFSGHQRR